MANCEHKISACIIHFDSVHHEGCTCAVNSVTNTFNMAGDCKNQQSEMWDQLSSEGCGCVLQTQGGSVNHAIIKTEATKREAFRNSPV